MSRQQQAVPLERYERTGKVHWSRIDPLDKKIVMHWLRANENEMVMSMIAMTEDLGGDVMGFELPPAFWTWLHQVRLWQRDRDRGVHRPRPEPVEVAA